MEMDVKQFEIDPKNFRCPTAQLLLSAFYIMQAQRHVNNSDSEI